MNPLPAPSLDASANPTVNALPTALSPAQLRRACDAHRLENLDADAAHDELLPGGLGQERAEAALRMGLEIAQPGFNVFVMGESGSGRHQLTLRVVRELARARPTPPELCYVHNFDEALRPRLLSLPAGYGLRLKNAMQDFVRELLPAVAAALDTEPHQQRVEALEEAHSKRENEALRSIGAACREDGLNLLSTTDGFAFVPFEGEETIAPEAYEALPAAERERIQAAVERWSEQLEVLLLDFPGWRREVRKAIERAEREAIAPVIRHLLAEPRITYAELPAVLRFFEAIEHDILHTSLDWISASVDADSADGGSDRGEGLSDSADPEASLLGRYQVKLLVEHGEGKEGGGAPVVFEDNPMVGGLIGRVETLSRGNHAASHFQLIRAGSLHRAQGGYLVIDAARLFSQPYAWEALKRVLRSREIRIEPPAEATAWGTQISLEPEPVPCTVKVVLIGAREIYYLLTESDSEFADLFKIVADTEDELPRDTANERRYARLLNTLAAKSQLLPVSPAALARLIDEAARIAEDRERLSLQSRFLVDRLREADYLARGRGASEIALEDLAAALHARRQRVGRYSEQIRRSMLEGSTLISTAGTRAGQINALVVVELAEELFGHPVRITATARVGDGDVVDIERETDLGGAIHSKGVMILSAFVAAHYARHQPLSLSASLVFEQSYAPVEGDSASLAELCALLSALAQLPLHQGIAVTGSVNQFGEVQAVGGVNEKIEGFFALCAARGLDGQQGVIVPQACVRQLMLQEEVVEAARAGRFHLWAVSHVDDAMHLLTGLPAGAPDAKGILPAGSVNQRVATALAEMTAAVHAAQNGKTRAKLRRDRNG